MKMNLYDQNNLKEEVLTDVVPVNNAPEIDEKPPVDKPQQALDDARRIKVLSPGMLVAKRFVRNKLAIVGLGILIFMFSFCFLGGWIIKYKQEDIFYKNDDIMSDYGTAGERTTYENYYVTSKNDIHYTVRNMMNSYISDMEANGLTQKTVEYVEEKDGEKKSIVYTVKKLGDKVYTLLYDRISPVAEYTNLDTVAEYNSLLGHIEFYDGKSVDNEGAFVAAIGTGADVTDGKQFMYDGNQYTVKSAGKKNQYKVYQLLADGHFTYPGSALSTDFETTVKANIASSSFTFDGGDYLIAPAENGGYTISRDFGIVNAYYSTPYVLNFVDTSMVLTDALMIEVCKALYGTGSFAYQSKTFQVVQNEEALSIYETTGGISEPYANLSTFVVRRFNGEDTLSIDFKRQLQEKVDDMIANRVVESRFTYYTPKLDAQGNAIVDENGDPVYDEAHFSIARQLDNFVLRNLQEKYLINIYEAPGKNHLLGTDGNGMDVLTRMMYGGRISLMIGFIVILLELILGVILGGLAGYFGKWVDQLIMRLVDIFNCIPTMPILIIFGALFDALRLSPYTRILYLMVILGVLGWSGVARLVRGQILSLREQEFMIAAEATGLSSRRRIFRHLVPNVIPQLIVTATMGLGSIIITESTLSFLGLGAKYPLATWGAMINSVSDATSMIKYTYIWVPVGLLICLTVIAFNFVGDGLRDAFDPKMKR